MIRHIPRNSCDLIAMADMRCNFIAIVVLLALGVIALRSASPVTNSSAANTSAPRWWLVVTAFVSGPASALAWFAADMLWISPGDYLVANDYAEPQIPIMTIGIIGGTIGAMAIWGSECMTCCSRRMRRRITTNVADEQSHAQEPAAEPVSNGKLSPPAR